MIGRIDGPLRWRTLNNRRFSFCWKSTGIFQYVKLPQMVGLFQLCPRWQFQSRKFQLRTEIETRKISVFFSWNAAKSTWNLKITQLKKKHNLPNLHFWIQNVDFPGCRSTAVPHFLAVWELRQVAEKITENDSAGWRNYFIGWLNENFCWERSWFFSQQSN